MITHERRQVRDHVAGHVQQQRARRVRRERRDAHEHVADLADARVRQQTLDVVLLQRHQVAEDHRRGREPGDHAAPVVDHRLERLANSRSSSANPAALEVAESSAVTGSGAPS